MTAALPAHRGSGRLEPVVPWRRYWLAGVGGLIAVQTVLLLILGRIDFQTGLVSALLHIDFVVAAGLGIAGGVLLVPDRKIFRRTTIICVVLVLGVLHWVVTLVGLGGFVTYRVARLAAPFGTVVQDPGLILSLLASVGFAPATVLIALAASLLVSLAIFAPVGGLLVDLVRSRWAGSTARRRRIVRWSVPLFFAASGLFLVAIPAQQRSREPLIHSFSETFPMAPLALILADKPASRPVLPRGDLPRARPLVLIIVDALRPDRMSVYDHRLSTTPFLAALQRAGVLERFDHAYGSCTYSYCGIMTILSSRTWDSFGAMPPTITDALSAHGYLTYLMLSGSHSSFGNLRRLYGDHITAFSDDVAGAATHDDDRSVIRLLRRTRFPDPSHSFVYFHLMSAHAGSWLLPRYRSAAPDIPLGISGPLGFGGASAGARYSDRYDRAVRQADMVIATIFRVLGQKGMLRDAVVVITADHGERLGEDGSYLHGGGPDRRVMAVPLLLVSRAAAQPPAHRSDDRHPVLPHQIRPIASQIDIAPTLLAAVGAAIPAGMTGVDLRASNRPAVVPIGTAEQSGAIAQLGTRIYEILCARDTGEETVTRFDLPVEAAIRRTPATRSLYDRLYVLYRQVHRPPVPPCSGVQRGGP